MTSPLHPADELAAILAHYLRALTTLSGKRWTTANDQDMARVAELLDQLTTTTTEADTDAMPAYERPIVSDRVTQVFERDVVQAAADEARAGRWRYAEEDDARRMLRREDGRR